jgi:transposase-like protein
MKKIRLCMNIQCCDKQGNPAPLIRHGTFFRQDDSRFIQRFRCRGCGKTYSSSTWSDAYRHRKRRITDHIRWLLGMKVSERAIARYLGINLGTVDFKLRFLGKRSRAYYKRLTVRNLEHVQFDELQTSVVSKQKPYAIPVAVCAKTRMILALGVASMPAQHPLVEKSLRNYGPLPDERPAAIEAVLRSIRPMMAKHSVITTDKAERYVEPISRILPNARHDAHKSRKARIGGGQGELKQIGKDPLFSLNHTAAMYRDTVGRLVRRTWGNSKRPDRLEDHLYIYAHFHNKHRLKTLPEGVVA